MNRGSVIDWSKYNLAMKAFETCDVDGNEGLTWAEIADCEVNITNIMYKYMLIIYVSFLHIFRLTSAAF